MKEDAKPLPLHLINYSHLEIHSFFYQLHSSWFPHQFHKFPLVSSSKVDAFLHKSLQQFDEKNNVEIIIYTQHKL